MGAALSACAAGTPPAPALDVEVVQQRGDIVAERVQLRVTNTADTAVTVTSATLSSAALEGDVGGRTRRPITIAPGRTTDLPVALERVRCTSGEAAARVAIALDDGRETTVPASDPLGALTRLSATRCDEEAVASIADVGATAVAVGGEGFAGLVLTVEPTPDATAGTLELVSLRGTTLLRFAGGEETPLDLSVTGGDDTTRVTVEVTPVRCDAHAVAEDKVGTVFDLVARVDGREVVVPLPRSQEVADALLVFTATTCGLSGPR